MSPNLEGQIHRKNLTNSMIKYSVVIPTYNRAEIIGKAIESVLAQTIQNYEIIVVDDGSTDNTCEVLNSLGVDIRYFRQTNQGPSEARNRGIIESRGQYVAFLDSDDLWYSNKLAKISEVIKEHPEAGLFYSDFSLTDKQGNKLRTERCKHIVGDGYHQLLLTNFIGTSTVVVKHECFDICGLFYEKLLARQDWDLWIRIAREFPIVHIPLNLVEHMKGSRGAVSANSTVMKSSRLVIERAVKADPRLSHSLLKKIEARLCYSEGVNYLQHEMKEKSLEKFKNTISLDPRFLKSYIYWGLVKADIIEYLPYSIKLYLRIFND